jgi:hypothetical protein
MFKCDDCGKENPDVKKTFCPYEDDVNDEQIEVYLCDDCYDERCMEI